MVFNGGAVGGRKRKEKLVIESVMFKKYKKALFNHVKCKAADNQLPPTWQNNLVMSGMETGSLVLIFSRCGDAAGDEGHTQLHPHTQENRGMRHNSGWRQSRDSRTTLSPEPGTSSKAQQCPIKHSHSLTHSTPYFYRLL